MPLPRYSSFYLSAGCTASSLPTDLLPNPWTHVACVFISASGQHRELGMETILRLCCIGKEKGTKSPHGILIMGCGQGEETNEIIDTKCCGISSHCDLKNSVEREVNETSR